MSLWIDEDISSDFEYDIINTTEVEKPHSADYNGWTVIIEEVKGE